MAAAGTVKCQGSDVTLWSTRQYLSYNNLAKSSIPFVVTKKVKIFGTAYGARIAPSPLIKETYYFGLCDGAGLRRLDWRFARIRDLGQTGLR